jgi:hypothetical protein
MLLAAFARLARADGLEVVLVFLFFEEVGDVKKGIPFQSDIDECRLHSG